MMNCDAFLNGFSAYLDGELPAERAAEFDDHLEACDDCRRYREVMERSLELVRALDPPSPTQGFTNRLNARLYVEDERRRATGPLGSGATSGTTVVMTLLFAAAAWSPAFGVSDAGEGLADTLGTTALVPELPAPDPLAETGLGAFSAGQISIYQAEELEQDLWSYPNEVFYAYSSLSRRNQTPVDRELVRVVGLQ